MKRLIPFLFLFGCQKTVVQLSSKPIAAADSIPPIVQNDTLYFIPFYGQSLSVGAKGYPVVSTTPVANLYTFTKGARMEHYDAYPNAYSGLSPLVEGKDTMPETPCSGMGRYFVAHHSGSLLTAAFGQSGKKIQELRDFRQGTLFYSRLIKGVTEGYRIACQLNKPFKVLALCWMQGEQNMGTNMQAYTDSLVAIRNNFNDDVHRITGQCSLVDFWIYQMASFNTSQTQVTNMPLVDLDIASGVSGFHFGTTMYQFDYNSSDNVHLANGEQYFQAGAAFGRNIIKEQALYVKSLSITKLVVNVAFNIPKPPLVFDTVNISKIDNYGFRVFNSSNQEVFPAKTYIYKDTVRLAFSGLTPKTDWKVSYGINGTKNKSGRTEGARGNLRDSNVDTFEGRNIYNWSWIFKKSIGN